MPAVTGRRRISSGRIRPTFMPLCIESRRRDGGRRLAALDMPPGMRAKQPEAARRQAVVPEHDRAAAMAKGGAAAAYPGRPQPDRRGRFALSQSLGLWILGSQPDAAIGGDPQRKASAGPSSRQPGRNDQAGGRSQRERTQWLWFKPKSDRERDKSDERERAGATQPDAALARIGKDRPGEPGVGHQIRRKTSVPLVPPKPKEFFSATSIFICRAVLAQ